MKSKYLPLLIFILLCGCSSVAHISGEKEVVQRLAELGPAQVDARQEGQWFDLSETQVGTRMSLIWAYVDEERVFIGYSLDNPPGVDLRPIRPLLVNINGPP